MRKLFLTLIVFVFPINSMGLLASELLYANNNSQKLEGIKSTKLTKSGKLIIKFCEKLTDLNGFVELNGQDLDIVDAKFVKSKKIVWENLKFDSNSTSYILNTENLKGKYRNEDLNDAPSKLAIGDCGPLNYAKGKTKSTLQLTQSSGIGALGVVLGVALAIGAGSSGGSGTSSHN